MMTYAKIVHEVGLNDAVLTAGSLSVKTPIDGSPLARLQVDSPADVEAKIAAAQFAFGHWRQFPAPRRGELVRLLGLRLRASKEALGRLVTLECGKIYQEGLGEVQEMIDICDLAVGLSRQLHGLTIVSERPGHSMRESWHPLGPCGVITAFNFPVAPWAWNAALALICGDPVLWKPSEKAPLCALATQAIFAQAIADFSEAPEHLLQVIIGEREAGAVLVESEQVPIISATGSTAMGRAIGPRIAQRFGRSILELGGNNAMIVAPSADLEMALRAIVFAAVGTAGQRCTSLRRLFVHDSIYESLLPRLQKAYAGLPVGDPLQQGSLVGPLIDTQALQAMQQALQAAKEQGGQVTGGERLLAERYPAACYVQPAIVEMPAHTAIICQETFAPILYVLRYQELEQAIALQNDVPQGLSSAIFSTDVRETEYFLSACGSDCGIANVNIGPSGAEIGGAFGGEKATGGGRESGSDAWKGYMRRQTNTINYSRDLPLAQGIEFPIEDA